MILQDKHVIPVLLPADKTTAATGTSWVNTANSTWLTFLVVFGAADGATVDVICEAASAGASTSAEQVAFRTRLTAAVGTDSMGAVAYNEASVGYDEAGSTLANAVLIIDVDPKDVPITKPYVRAQLTGSSGNNVYGAVAVTTPYVARAVPATTS